MTNQEAIQVLSNAKATWQGWLTALGSMEDVLKAAVDASQAKDIKAQLDKDVATWTKKLEEVKAQISKAEQDAAEQEKARKVKVEELLATENDTYTKLVDQHKQSISDMKRELVKSQGQFEQLVKTRESEIASLDKQVKDREANLDRVNKEFSQFLERMAVKP